MDRMKKLIEALSLKINILNIIVGIAFMLSLILIFLEPDNKFAVLSACIAGGFINILNGLKIWKDPKRKTMGLSYVMMGIIIIVLGFVLFDFSKH